jgi:ABC-type Fe3+-siderophore transport system permease subunit
VLHLGLAAMALFYWLFACGLILIVAGLLLQQVLKNKATEPYVLFAMACVRIFRIIFCISRTHRAFFR